MDFNFTFPIFPLFRLDSLPAAAKDRRTALADGTRGQRIRTAVRRRRPLLDPPVQPQRPSVLVRRRRHGHKNQRIDGFFRRGILRWTECCRSFTDDVPLNCLRCHLRLRIPDGLSWLHDLRVRQPLRSAGLLARRRMRHETRAQLCVVQKLSEGAAVQGHLRAAVRIWPAPDQRSNGRTCIMPPKQQVCLPIWLPLQLQST